jgi:hypothetical protein
LLGLVESRSSFAVPRSYDETEDEWNDDEDAGEDGGLSQRELKRRREIEKLTLQNLGILRPANLAACPLTSIDRTEKLADRDWRTMTNVESDVQEFLEHGTQLPEAALDEFVAPLWDDEPFKSKGFVLVGFPNTAADIAYLLEKKYFPEFVHILDVSFIIQGNSASRNHDKIKGNSGTRDEYTREFRYR